MYDDEGAKALYKQLTLKWNSYRAVEMAYKEATDYFEQKKLSQELSQALEEWKIVFEEYRLTIDLARKNKKANEDDLPGT